MRRMRNLWKTGESRILPLRLLNGTPAVTEARTTKTSSGPTKASKPQHIPIILPYVNCSTMVNSTDMQYCSRCKVRGYCSKECRVEEWKRHRQFCVQYNADDEKNMSNMSRAVEKLIRLLSMNSSKSIFSTRRSNSTTLQLIDLASVAAVYKTRTRNSHSGVQQLRGVWTFSDRTITVQENASKYPG